MSDSAVMDISDVAPEEETPVQETPAEESVEAPVEESVEAPAEEEPAPAEEAPVEEPAPTEEAPQEAPTTQEVVQNVQEMLTTEPAVSSESASLEERVKVLEEKLDIFFNSKIYKTKYS